MNPLKFIFLLLFFCCAFQAIAEQLDVYWIDVRTLEEYDSGHLEQAIQIDYREIAEKMPLLIPNKNSEIHLYCRTGRRSGLAKKSLDELGYNHIINEGGYQDLINR